MSRTLTLLLILCFGVGCGQKTGKNEPLLLFCAAGIRIPVTELATAFEAETGSKVDLQFAGSNTLLGNIAASGQGDLYLAADASYIDIARERGLLVESLPVAQLSGGLLVAQGNPKNITSLSELSTRNDLKIALGNPDAAAIGKFAKKAMMQAGFWPAVEERITVLKPTVNELANDVVLGAVDVAIVWDAVAAQYPKAEFIRVPTFETRKKQVTIGVLASSEQPAAALAFARFLASKDRGAPVFRTHGHDVPTGGDTWATSPEITLFSGAMLRPAIEERITAFEAREGVRVNRVYNGCGVLVSQMRAGERPDAYFSCDQSFLDDVDDLFEPGTTVSGNPMVILAAKGTSKQIRTVADLAAPALKVGLAHPEKSALGALTERGLRDLKLWDAISKNKVVDSATGDFLVNQVRAGALDAAIVYLSNARATPQTLEECRVIPIKISGASARAVQPYAIGTNSSHPQLCARLLQALTGSAERAHFESLGFDWELTKP